MSFVIPTGAKRSGGTCGASDLSKSRSFMKNLRTLTLRLPTVAVFISSGILLQSQTAASQSTHLAQLAISLAPEESSFPPGQKPRALLTFENLSDHTVCVLTNTPYRVHIERKDGEPPKTEYYRHLLSDFHPGDGPDQSGGSNVCPEIAPHKSRTENWDLSAYYDLTLPGKYSVYIEVEWPSMTGPEAWLRTNMVQFEVTASAK